MFGVGVTGTFTLSVFNGGPSDARDVMVTDALPATLRFVSSPTCAGSGQAVTCALGTIPAGGHGSATVNVTVAEGTPPGTTIVNTATVTTSTPSGPAGAPPPATVAIVTQAHSAPPVAGIAVPARPGGLAVTGMRLIELVGTGLVLVLAGLMLLPRYLRNRRRL